MMQNNTENEWLHKKAAMADAQKMHDLLDTLKGIQKLCHGCHHMSILADIRNMCNKAIAKAEKRG